jgi:hypothetical protein
MSAYRKSLSVLITAVLLSASQSAPGQVTGGDIITGAGTTSPHVKRFDALTLAEEASFFAYPGFLGGVHVAAGDIDGDQKADIITGVPSTAPHVKVFSGATGAEIRSFFAFTGFAGGVYVGSADLNNDDVPEILAGVASGGNAHVKAFDSTTLQEQRSFFAYDGFAGGVRVAGGDVNNDGFDDIITGTGPGAIAHVKAFSGVNNDGLASFFPYGPGYTGGVFVAAGDVNGDGRDDIITGTEVGSPLKSLMSPISRNSEAFLPFPAFWAACASRPPTSPVTGGPRSSPARATARGRSRSSTP